MKTLKVLIALCIMVGFATNAVNAQKPGRVVFTLPVVYYIPCLDQNLTGDLLFERYYLNNHFQSFISGTLTGEGDIIYSVRLMNEVNEDFAVEGKGNYTWVHSLFLELDGKLIAKVMFAYHYTYNANGELVVETENYKVLCK
jgi:hypothetical protein